MALQLEKELEDGSVGNYWSISTINVSDTQSRVYLSLHKNQAAKQSGKTPMKEISKFITHTKNDIMTNNIYDFAYGQIKISNIVDGVELNEFASAVDV